MCKQCPICESFFIVKKNRRILCSENCRRIYRYRRIKAQTIENTGIDTDVVISESYAISLGQSMVLPDSIFGHGDIQNRVQLPIGNWEDNKD